MKKAADLLPRLAERVADLPRHAPTIVAVSGGLDSVVLLDLLHRAGFTALVVAHYHHGLRGTEADRDRQHVSQLARGYALPFVTARGRTRERARQRRETLEEAARHLRRNFLARIAKKHQAARIFLGHHAGDVAETMLFHLARGSGPRGLAALRATAPLDDTGLTLERPLLFFTRKEIAEYAAARNLTYVEDTSNQSPAHTRNRLRHEILPALADAMGFDPAPAMTRLADILATEESWWNDHLAARATQTFIDLPDFRAQHPAIQRRWLHAWIKNHTRREPGYDNIEQARQLAMSSLAPAKINLLGNHHLRRRQGSLFIEFPKGKRHGR
jgi:tRNA(Ile)-lysidine synthase